MTKKEYYEAKNKKLILDFLKQSTMGDKKFFSYMLEIIKEENEWRKKMISNNN